MKLPGLLLLIHSVTVAVAEDYSFDFSSANGPMISAPGHLPTRMLFEEDEPCWYDGAFLVCRYSFITEGSIGGTQVDFQARCDADSQIKFDFRRAKNCACQAIVNVPNQPPLLTLCR